MKNIRKVYFPLMWADETATIDDASADLYKSKATIPLLLLDVFSFGSIGLGLLGTVLSLIFFTWNHYIRRKTQVFDQKLK